MCYLQNRFNKYGTESLDTRILPRLNDNLGYFMQIRYIKVVDITNLSYNEQVYPVPWHCVKSRFHRIQDGIIDLFLRFDIPNYKRLRAFVV